MFLSSLTFDLEPRRSPEVKLTYALRTSSGKDQTELMAYQDQRDPSDWVHSGTLKKQLLFIDNDVKYLLAFYGSVENMLAETKTIWDTQYDIYSDIA